MKVIYGPVTAYVDRHGRLHSLNIDLPGMPGSAIAASVLAAVQIGIERLSNADQDSSAQ